MSSPPQALAKPRRTPYNVWVMKAAPLLLLAVCLSAPSRAQSPSGTTAAAPFLEKEELLAEIDSWRSLHLSKSGSQAEPAQISKLRQKLAAISERVKKAPDDPSLKEARKDFEDWKKLLLSAEYAENAAIGMNASSLAEFSYGQNIAAHIVTDQHLAFERQKASMAAREAARFFDNSRQGQGAPVFAFAAADAGSPSHAGEQPVAPTFGLRINPTPAAAPPPTTAALDWSSVSSFFDWDKGQRVAREVVERARGYVEKCYAYVKQALINADVLDVPDRTQTRLAGFRPGMARMFAEDANKNPKVLAKLGYRRVDARTIAGDDPSIIPDGSILVYAAGCAGFSKTAGHIELTASREMLPHLRKSMRSQVASRLDDDQVLACSDGCSGRTLNYIRTYAKKGCLNMYVPVRQD